MIFAKIYLLEKMGTKLMMKKPVCLDLQSTRNFLMELKLYVRILQSKLNVILTIIAMDF